MYKNFFKLTDSLKNKGNTLILMFDFKIAQPDYHQADKELTDTLEAMVFSLHEHEAEPGTPELLKMKSKDEKWGEK